MTVDPSAVTAAEPSTGAASSTPATVGKYRLDRVIGSGGMGIVWAAFDPDLERSVALKLLHAESSEPTLRSRLLREARAMARLRHPNVVTVYEVGTDQNRDYIAMELVDGSTLETWFDTKPTRAQLLEALVAAGKGLAAAHTAGLVHRDFKPHNVLRATDGHVYVTDFGLARGQIEDGADVVQLTAPAVALDSGKRRRDSVLDSPLTQTGVLIGTPAYMAPEQFAGRVPDPKSDQFAFCITAWEAFTGARPFRGGTLEELEAAARGGVRDLAADLPPRIRAVLSRGLDPDPEARWPDVPALLAALATAVGEPPRPRRRRVLAIAIALSVLAIGGGTAMLLSDRASAKKSASGDCADPAAAFASAWGDTQRAALRENHGAPSLAAVAILDETSRRWIHMYTTTCAQPKSAERDARLECLAAARESAGSTIRGVLPRAVELDPTSLAGLVVGVVMCDPSHAGDEPDPDVIVGPVPPVPPVPPPGDGDDEPAGSGSASGD